MDDQVVRFWRPSDRHAAGSVLGLHPGRERVGDLDLDAGRLNPSQPARHSGSVASAHPEAANRLGNVLSEPCDRHWVSIDQLHAAALLRLSALHFIDRTRGVARKLGDVLAVSIWNARTAGR